MPRRLSVGLQCSFVADLIIDGVDQLPPGAVVTVPPDLYEKGCVDDATKGAEVRPAFHLQPVFGPNLILYLIIALHKTS